VAGTTAERDVDRAALLGTALAAVVALTFGGRGPWDWIASCAGLALLAILLAFFRLPATSPNPRSWQLELAAVAAVAGLATTLVVAPLMQFALSLATPGGATCQDSGTVAAATVRHAGPAHVGPTVLSAAAREARDTATGECLGALTNQWLWAPALGSAALIFCVRPPARTPPRYHAAAEIRACRRGVCRRECGRTRPRTLTAR
jgi:hypothetical protein